MEMMMAKRFKLRIPSFPCCRPKNISAPPPPLSRHVTSAFKTAGCVCGSRSTNSDEGQREEEAATSGPSECYDAVLAPPPPEKKKKKRRLKKKKTMTSRLRISTSSSAESFFSDGEETETLVSSSKSISSDDNPYKTKKKKKIKKRNVKASEMESPARLSVFQRLIPCTVEGKIRESFAVVKKSEDPYGDFKRSMMEMIMEKEMFDGKDLEQLLHCLLSLNDREHHGVIVQAFSEIWQSLFCRRSSDSQFD